MVRSVRHAAAGVENTFALYLSLLATPPGGNSPDDAKRQRYLDTMDAQRRRLSSLYNAVFDFLPTHDRPDATFDLTQSLRHAEVLAATLAKDRNVTLEVDGNAGVGLQLDGEIPRQAALDGLLWAVERAASGATVTARLAGDGDRVSLAIDAPPPADPTPPADLADRQAELRAIGGDVRWDVAPTLHIELALPCSPAESN